MGSASRCDASIRLWAVAAWALLAASCGGTEATDENPESAASGPATTMATAVPTAAEPPAPATTPITFFEGVWEAQGLVDLDCGLQLSDLAGAAWNSQTYFIGYEMNEEGTSYTGHRCTSAIECSDAPFAGMTYTLSDGVWRAQVEDGWVPEGDQCYYLKHYREHWVDGETLYDVEYEDRRPVNGDASEPLGCIGETTSGFECASVQAIRYQRVGPYP